MAEDEVVAAVSLEKHLRHSLSLSDASAKGRLLMLFTKAQMGHVQTGS